MMREASPHGELNWKLLVATQGRMWYDYIYIYIYFFFLPYVNIPESNHKILWIRGGTVVIEEISPWICQMRKWSSKMTKMSVALKTEGTKSVDPHVTCVVYCWGSIARVFFPATCYDSGGNTSLDGASKSWK